MQTELIPANKVRINGNPKILIQGDVRDKHCLIVDDIADGGRTFRNLALALKNSGARKVFLYLSHGQFNYGFSELQQSITHIFCTNSFRNLDHPSLSQFKIDGLL